MTQWWLIVGSDNTYRQVQTDGVDPSKAGEDLTGKKAYRMNRRGDFTSETPNLVAGTWSENLPAVKAALLNKIDDQRETEQMRYLTPGGAKKMVYMQKSKEALDFRALGSAVIATLNLETQRVKFPAAMAQVDATGATLTSVIAEFEAGANTANTKVLKVEALAQKAKAAIKAATSAGQARAAAIVNWNV